MDEFDDLLTLEPLLQMPSQHQQLQNSPSDTTSSTTTIDDKEEDLRPRCYTWPRPQFQLQLQSSDTTGVGPSPLTTPLSGGYLLSHNTVPQPPTVSLPSEDVPFGPTPTTTSSLATGGLLPQVSEEEMDAKETDNMNLQSSPTGGNTTVHVMDESYGSPKQKTSSRRNPWGNTSYADLITQAIQSTPDQRLTLAQIYEWLVKNIPHFRDKGDSVSSNGWKNSIRHNLSLHSRFMRMQNEGTGKSSWWMLNPDAAKGNCGVKHHRKRSNTLESATSRIDKRRGSSGTSASSTTRRREQSGSCRATPTLGRRSTMTAASPAALAVQDLERAASSGSLSYPESPAFGSSDFATSMRPRTLSNASSCGGGRMSPNTNFFRPRTQSIESSSTTLDGSLGQPLSPPCNWPQRQQCQSPIFDYIEKLRLSDDKQPEVEEDLDNIKLTDFGLDIANMQAFLNGTNQETNVPKEIKTESPPTPPTPEASPEYKFEEQQILNNNEQQLHKIKILEPRDSNNEAQRLTFDSIQPQFRQTQILPLRTTTNLSPLQMNMIGEQHPSQKSPLEWNVQLYNLVHQSTTEPDLLAPKTEPAINTSCTTIDQHCDMDSAATITTNIILSDEIDTTNPYFEDFVKCGFSADTDFRPSTDSGCFNGQSPPQTSIVDNYSLDDVEPMDNINMGLIPTVIDLPETTPTTNNTASIFDNQVQNSLGYLPSNLANYNNSSSTNLPAVSLGSY